MEGPTTLSIAQNQSERAIRARLCAPVLERKRVRELEDHLQKADPNRSNMHEIPGRRSSRYNQVPTAAQTNRHRPGLSRVGKLYAAAAHTRRQSDHHYLFASKTFFD